jgi:hypothetical protein
MWLPVEALVRRVVAEDVLPQRDEALLVVAAARDTVEAAEEHEVAAAERKAAAAAERDAAEAAHATAGPEREPGRDGDRTPGSAPEIARDQPVVTDSG